MANSFFKFKQFTVHQDACAMKVCTDACLFGAWCAAELEREKSAAQTLLDIGAGTGLLSLMVRQKNKMQIDAVEIEEAAAAQAIQNVQASPWLNDIHVRQCDILHMNFSKSYDCIISNPPFYQNELQSPDSKRNTAHHSSRLTLPALITVVAKQLKPDGCFFLLLPYKRREEARAHLYQNNLVLYKEMLVCQSETHRPFRIMIKCGFEKKEVETGTITITSNQQYTPALKELLHEYYLYL